MVKHRAGNSINRTGSADEHVSDDAKAFRAAVRDVQPLAQTPTPMGLMKRKSPAPRRSATTISNIMNEMPLVDPSPGEIAVSGDEILSFQRAGVRSQVFRRLRRGLYPIEGDLDLHGLSQTNARDYLGEFIAGSRGAGLRCIRIVHGKGYRSGARGPVLKVAVNSWLRHHLDVMAFTSARAIDGGSGAVYVLLRT